MNKNIIIASAITAGAAALIYLIKKNRKVPAAQPLHRPGTSKDFFAKSKREEDQSLNQGV